MAEFQLTITDILLDSSKLVPDALLIDIIKDRLARDGVLSGWMQDVSPGPCPRLKHWTRFFPHWARRSMSF